jgi:hypothetical protein
MAYRNLWLIDMGDGTWAVSCMTCRLALYRGPKQIADRVFASHRCEPVIPLGRRRRSAQPQAVPGTGWAAPGRTRPRTDASPTHPTSPRPRSSS